MSKDSQLFTAKCCIVSIALAAVPAWAADVQSGIDEFNPNVNGYVNAIAVAVDAKVVIGGFFTMVGGQPRTNIALLHPDGSLDRAFNPSTFNAWASYSSIADLAVQDDEKLLVAGEFRSSTGQRLSGLVRLNLDGGLDTTFNPQTDGWVARVEVNADGKILIGGNFNTVNGEPRKGLARLNSDGSLDSGYNPNVGISVNDFAMKPDGAIAFPTYGLATDRVRMVCVSSEGDLSWCFEEGVEQSNDPISTFALLPDDKFVLSRRNDFGFYLVRLQSSGVDPTFHVGAGLWAEGLVVQPDGKILVAGGNTNYW